MQAGKDKPPSPLPVSKIKPAEAPAAKNSKQGDA